MTRDPLAQEYARITFDRQEAWYQWLQAELEATYRLRGRMAYLLTRLRCHGLADSLGVNSGS